MSIFISYSHHDSRFVDRLAAELVHHKARVWIDRWELNVGDSLIDRIQGAMQTATALIVILSRASIGSEWCKKELSAGLLRELEERRVVVLPVLVEDCEIPLLLRDKVYADFRADYDAGLRKVLEAIARVTSDGQGRIDRPEWHIDWAIDWGIPDGKLFLRLTTVEQARDKPYCILSETNMVGNDVATARYAAFLENDLDWIERLAILEVVGGSMREGALSLQFVLDDQFPRVRTRVVADPELGVRYELEISVRRLGEDNGKDVFFDYREQFRQVTRQLRDVLRQPTQQERSTIETLFEKLK